MYEYTQKTIEGYRGIAEKANDMDVEGWELVSVLPVLFDNGWKGFVAIFRKKKG